MVDETRRNLYNKISVNHSQDILYRSTLMKPLSSLFIILALTSLACSLEFNPPPLSFTPPPASPTAAPLLITPTSVPIITSTPIPPTSAPIPTDTTVPPTPAPSGLTLDQLKSISFTFTSPDQVQQNVTLSNGKYTSGSDPAAPGYFEVTLLNKIASADLNNDGAQDAIVIIDENFGSTGDYQFITAVLNQAGQPVVTAMALFDDRPIINGIAIQNGYITVDALVHGPYDPKCCADQPTNRIYLLQGGRLILSHVTTTTPSGDQRIITIENPVSGTTINTPFILKGGISTTPFENSLVYTLFGPGSNDPLDQYAFTVSGDGLGGPGTFELPLDLASKGIHGEIRIEISYLSPADGAYLAQDIITLTIQ